MPRQNTAMRSTNPSPALLWIMDRYPDYFRTILKRDITILDHGAGHGRNSNYLRDLGYKVYSYDPYNGEDINGFKGVSNRKPLGRYCALGISCYVLNVVTEKEEKKIIKNLKEYCSIVFIIVRNKDLYQLTPDKQALKDGFETSKGLQRLTYPNLDLVKEKYGYRIYKIGG